MPDDDKELFEDAIGAREQKPEPAPEPEREEPGTLEAEPSVEPDEPEAEGDPQEPEPEEQPAQEPDHRIPLPEYLATRERAQKAERERERLEQELAQMRQQAQQKPREVPEIWDNPGGFVQAQLDPVQQAIEAAHQKSEQNFQRMSKVMAVQTHGQETVDAAFDALREAMSTSPTAQFDYQRIMASDHPFGELVNWHKQQEATREFGSDPQAYRQKLQEALLNDPEFRKQAMETWNAQARGNPSERPQSKTQLPPSLSRTPAAKADKATPAQSDAELLNEALGSR